MRAILNASGEELVQRRAARWQAEPVGALVIGGGLGGLGTARSLGRRGIPVTLVCAADRLAQWSRYVQRTFSWREGGDTGEAAEHLCALATKHRLDGWAVIPCTDFAVKTIALHHDRLSRFFRLTTQGWDVLEWAYDKRLTYARASCLGVDCPRVYRTTRYAEIAELDCQYPVVLKPAFREGINHLTLDKAWRADNRETLLDRYAAASSLMNAEEVIVQEFIPGGGKSQYSYAALWDDKGPRASLVAKRLRQYPIDFGHTSTYVQTVEEPQVEESAERFLRSIQYRGLVEVEFKFDARDGRFKLLDVNPRIWAWHTLGKRAGVDFPYLLWQMASGEHAVSVRSRAGVSWLHLSKDLLAGIQEIRRGRTTAGAYARSLSRGRGFAIAAKDDFLPAFADLPLLAQGALRRFSKRRQDA